MFTPKIDTLADELTLPLSDDPTIELSTLVNESNNRVSDNPYQISDAMRAAAPADLTAKQAYMVGAVAATIRRTHPIAAPAPFAANVRRPSDNGDLRYGDIMIEDMPYIASPIVELVRTEMPDLVMAADRGGRMLGLAVFAAWRQRYPDAPFPSIDGKVHFGRISKRVDEDAGREVLLGVLNRSGVMAEMAQRKSDGDKQPLKVLFLDDWVYEGITVQQVHDAIAKLALNPGQRLEYMVGTMRGTQLSMFKHVVGDTRREHGKGTWADDGDAIGVDYDTRSGWGTRPVVKRTETARALRRGLRTAIEAEIVPSPHKSMPELTTGVQSKEWSEDSYRRFGARVLQLLGYRK